MRRFLISRLSALGDTVCSLPAAVALKQAFPDSHITWVVDPRFAGIVECCSAVNEVVPFRPSWRRIPKYPERFDAALDLQGLFKSAICICRAKAERKVGYHWAREGAGLFYQRILPDPTSHHVVDQYVDVARFVIADLGAADTRGPGGEKTNFSLKASHDDVLSVRRKLKERGGGGRIVVVNAGAGWVTKRWPTASFAAAIDAVQSQGVRAILIGGNSAADRLVADEVIAQCKTEPVNMLGETSVRELVALIRLASLHLGGDTGSTHIAAALDIPAVGLYSITRPQRSCPYGQISRCHYDPRGLDFISPESVIHTIGEIL